MTRVIDAQALAKRYPTGTVALDDLTLAVVPGEMIALLGPSGAGKTTFFRLCNGTVSPTTGRLEVLGTHMAGVRGRALQRLRRRVAVVYQTHNLVGSMSVLQNVLVGRLGRVSLVRALRSAVWPSDADLAEVHQVLRDLEIADKIYSRVDDLSGGQRQRVAIARALIQRPELLLADEPVASVDDDTASTILSLLRREGRRRGTTVIVSLHQRQYVDQYCDRAVELRGGRLAADYRVGAPEQEPSLVGAST